MSLKLDISNSYLTIFNVNLLIINNYILSLHRFINNKNTQKAISFSTG